MTNQWNRHQKNLTNRSVHPVMMLNDHMQKNITRIKNPAIAKNYPSGVRWKTFMPSNSAFRPVHIYKT